MREPKQYKHSQKSKFHDKGREETDKGEENITENLVGNRTIVEIKTRNVPIFGGGGGEGKQKGIGKIVKKMRE